MDIVSGYRSGRRDFILLPKSSPKNKIKPERLVKKGRFLLSKYVPLLQDSYWSETREYNPGLHSYCCGFVSRHFLWKCTERLQTHRHSQTTALISTLQNLISHLRCQQNEQKLCHTEKSLCYNRSHPNYTLIEGRDHKRLCLQWTFKISN